MKCCILGGGGYLGQVLTRDLQAAGHDVVSLDLQYLRFPPIAVDWEKVKCITGSILQQSKLREALEGCDACFHLAAYGMSGGPSLDKKMTHLVNVEGTQLVIDECIRAGCRRLIYTSTVAVVFGSQEVVDLTEDAPYCTSFINAYSESKCAAEKIVLKTGKDGDLETCALRLRGIYGPGEIRSTQKTVDMCIQGIFKASFEKSDECLSQYSSAENVSSAMVLAEKSLRQGNHSPTNGNAYFIVDGGAPVKNLAFWYPLIESLGFHAPTIRMPYWLVYYFVFFLEVLYHLFKIEPLMTRLEVNLVSLTNTYSIEAARRDFGYNPVNNHCLKSTIEYYKTHPAYSLKSGEKRVDSMKNDKFKSLSSEAFLSKVFMFATITVISSFVWPFLQAYQ